MIELAGNKIHHEENILIMTCQEERLQIANKEKVIHHFRQLLTQVLTKEKERIPTQLPKSQREARIVEKKITGKIKQSRQKPTRED